MIGARRAVEDAQQHLELEQAKAKPSRRWLKHYREQHRKAVDNFAYTEELFRLFRDRKRIWTVGESKDIDALALRIATDHRRSGLYRLTPAETNRNWIRQHITMIRQNRIYRHSGWCESVVARLMLECRARKEAIRRAQIITTEKEQNLQNENQ